jgi:hypothetical protein
MARCVSDIARKWQCRESADTFVVESGRIRTQFEAAWQKGYDIAIRELTRE